MRHNSVLGSGLIETGISHSSKLLLAVSSARIFLLTALLVYVTLRMLFCRDSYIWSPRSFERGILPLHFYLSRAFYKLVHLCAPETLTRIWCSRTAACTKLTKCFGELMPLSTMLSPKFQVHRDGPV